MKTQISIFFFVLLALVINAQVSVTNGNLLRIDINSDKIDKADTLWHWTKISKPDYYSTEDCYNIFYNNKKPYLLISTRWEYTYMPGWGGNSYSITTPSQSSSKALGSFGNAIDVLPEPYISVNPQILLTDKGFWFLGGIIYGCTYVDNNDSTYKYNSKSENSLRLTHILGKIADKYLIAVRTAPRSYVYDYYLTDFSNLPDVTLNKRIYFPYKQPSSSAPLSIHYLQDSLFLVKNERTSAIDLLIFSGDSLKIVKQSIIDIGRWVLDGTKLTYLDYDNSTNTFGISRAYFNVTGLKFTEGEKLLTNLERVTFNSNHAAWLKNDTLYYVALNALPKVKKYPLAGIKVTGNLILTPPYVFINQINSITDVKSDNIPLNYSLSQNYPNPFNPETTISYTISNAEHVTLKVFDLLGQEVATLVDEYKNAGTYNSKFSIINYKLVSGVYFYRLQAGSYSETKKLILMK